MVLETNLGLKNYSFFFLFNKVEYWLAVANKALS